MPSYVNPIRVTYTRTVAGATTATWYISPPAGCTQFRVEDIQASVTTAFVGTTSAGRLGVGVAGNVNAAGYIDFGTTSVPAPVNSTVGLTTQKVVGTNPLYGALDLSGTSNTITTPVKVPEVLGPVLITNTAAAGSQAGAAVVDVTIAWF